MFQASSVRPFTRSNESKKPSIEEPVMIRAEHHDILDAVRTAAFAWNEMADVARRQIPATDHALIGELATSHFAKGA